MHQSKVGPTNQVIFYPGATAAAASAGRPSCREDFYHGVGDIDLLLVKMQTKEATNKSLEYLQ